MPEVDTLRLEWLVLDALWWYVSDSVPFTDLEGEMVELRDIDVDAVLDGVPEVDTLRLEWLVLDALWWYVSDSVPFIDFDGETVEL